ncbi:DUF6325 family protein [Demequina mangrovi]|uniref:DUF1269 domain-containing protein n=1 Tax=Demequina mangrovi TaxID=1043493 RepID=A0A1H6WZF1_9MICO|nr:DUF6325 family protein [Demequina mangrovi]SEJ22178.1 hypothetical protein SAMN05421637_1210 [Demequina mangrovi]
MIGPVEIVTIAFPEDRFDGSILPELTRLVETGTISLVDAVIVRKDTDENVEIIELSEVTDDPDVTALSGLLARMDGLLSDEDAEIVVEALPPGGTAAILCFEHSWVVPLRDAIAANGGELLDTVRVPGTVVQEVLDAVGAEA